MCSLLRSITPRPKVTCHRSGAIPPCCRLTSALLNECWVNEQSSESCRGKMRILIALLVVCVGSAAFWASLDHRLDAPDWEGQFKGVSYSPSHLYTEHEKDTKLTDDMIRRDLEQLSHVTKRIRTYTVSYHQDRIPAIAKEFGLKVSLGIWLNDNLKHNDEEIARGIQVIKDNPGTIDRVFVGNEAVGVRKDLTVEQVSAYIREVK